MDLGIKIIVYIIALLLRDKTTVLPDHNINVNMLWHFI